MTTSLPTDLPEHDIRPEDTLAFIHVPKADGITLGIHVADTFAPAALDPANQDTRLLGVAVNRIHQDILPEKRRKHENSH